MDHVAGIPHHTSKRALASFHPKPTYHIPSHLEEPLRKVFEGFSAMNGEDIAQSMNIKCLDAGTEIEVRENIFKSLWHLEVN